MSDITKKMQEKMKEPWYKSAVKKALIYYKNGKKTDAVTISTTATPLSTHSTNFATIHHVASTFSEEHHLFRCWILDSGSDIHVFNHSEGFTITRPNDAGDQLFGGKNAYAIKAYGIIQVNLETPTGPMSITLHNVALIPGYLTNIIAMERLSQNGVH